MLKSTDLPNRERAKISEFHHNFTKVKMTTDTLDISNSNMTLKTLEGPLELFTKVPVNCFD